MTMMTCDLYLNMPQTLPSKSTLCVAGDGGHRTAHRRQTQENSFAVPWISNTLRLANKQRHTNRLLANSHYLYLVLIAKKSAGRIKEKKKTLWSQPARSKKLLLVPHHLNTSFAHKLLQKKKEMEEDSDLDDDLMLLAGRGNADAGPSSGSRKRRSNAVLSDDDDDEDDVGGEGGGRKKRHSKKREVRLHFFLFFCISARRCTTTGSASPCPALHCPVSRSPYTFSRTRGT